MSMTTTEQIDKIVSRILSDYRGLVIGNPEFSLSEEQLHFRIKVTLIAAQNGELETELHPDDCHQCADPKAEILNENRKDQLRHRLAQCSLNELTDLVWALKQQILKTNEQHGGC